ncbi:MAG: sialate O-acetylesterase, partial [Bacteroides sp.]|nr:sialate O-acetylesterase [Bacteroides sp.]
PAEHAPTDLTPSSGSVRYRATHAGGVRNSVKALIWLQGESNQKTGYDRYTEDFARLYEGWKRDYPSLEKIYMSQINTGCGDNEHGAELREAQRQIGKRYPEIELIANVGLPLRPDDCHYTREAHDTLWSRFYRLIARDLYAEPGEYLVSPDVTEVCYTDPERNTLRLTFDQPVTWPEGSSTEMLSRLFLNEKKEYVKVSEVYTVPEEPHAVFLILKEGGSVQALTYGPDGFIPDQAGNLIRYAGPWITNLNGIPALTFDKVKVFTMYGSTIYD